MLSTLKTHTPQLVDPKNAEQDPQEKKTLITLAVSNPLLSNPKNGNLDVLFRNIKVKEKYRMSNGW